MWGEGKDVGGAGIALVRYWNTSHVPLTMGLDRTDGLLYAVKKSKKRISGLMEE